MNEILGNALESLKQGASVKVVTRYLDENGIRVMSFNACQQRFISLIGHHYQLSEGETIVQPTTNQLFNLLKKRSFYIAESTTEDIV